MEKTKKIKIMNRDSGIVGYVVPDLGINRNFTPGETKEIQFEEIEKLMWTPGGESLLRNYLIIKDEEAIAELFESGMEPEYYYNEEDIKNLLLNGTLDQLLDCFDYAPDGVLEILKKQAVALEINDIRKRKAIKEALNFDVDTAIMVTRESKIDDVQEAKTERRSNPINSNQTQTKIIRRTNPIKE